MSNKHIVHFKVEKIDSDAYRTEAFDWLRARIGDDARIQMDRSSSNSLRSANTAIISIPESEASRVESLNGVMFLNSKLSVSKGESPRNRKTTAEPRKERKPVEGPTSTLFLSHSALSTRSGDNFIGIDFLMEEFKPYGIVDVRMPKPRYCFLDFETVENATAALSAMNGKIVKDKPYNIEYSNALPKPKDTPNQTPAVAEAPAEVPAEEEKAANWESTNWD